MKKNIKRYRDLETGKIFTVDLNKVHIYKRTGNDKEDEKNYEEFEKTFSDTEEEEEGDDNSEET